MVHTALMCVRSGDYRAAPYLPGSWAAFYIIPLFVIS